MGKKLLVLIMSMILICGLALSVQAAENDANSGTAATQTATNPPDKGQLTILGGNVWNSEGDFYLSKHFALTEIYKEDVLKLGMLYQASDAFRANAGIRYDTKTQTSVPFGRFDFKLPFGDNLKITGFAAQNYDGVDWTSYEAAIQIEVFKDLYIYPGVRGEFGSTVPTYAYNPTKETYLFLHGDFNWKAGRFDFGVQPYLFICNEGVWFHNYTIKYHVSDNIALVTNYNTMFDREPKFMAGIQWKF